MSKSVATKLSQKKSENATLIKQTIGLDVSKDKVDVCFAEQWSDKPFRVVSTKTFAITEKGFALLLEWIKKNRKESSVPLYLMMEATGVYYEKLAYLLHGKNYSVTVILANKGRKFAETLSEKQKTDAIDAKMLAQFAIEREHALWCPPSPIMLKIKRLCRERVDLLEQKTAALNQLHAKNISYEPNVNSMKRSQEFIKFCDELIEAIELEIKQTIQTDADIKQRIDNVCTIKGVAIVTAATVVSEANGFALFENKAQLVSYTGYDVPQKSSGGKQLQKPCISKHGNSHIRRALHFPAITAAKYNDHLGNLSKRIIEKTSIPMKGYVAVQRKLLVLIYTLYKNNVPFDADYEQKLKEQKDQKLLLQQGNTTTDTKNDKTNGRKICKQELTPAYPA